MPRLDHPRACGANVVESFGEFCGHGSSPRMRGKRNHPADLTVEYRIIPAHAGQTSATISIPSNATDHPRACGANTVESTNSHENDGSSPRMRGKRAWGKRAWGKEENDFERIIPAHAGQTPAMPHRAGSSPDHPRACGANERCFCCHDGMPGSSPRMRGKPFRTIPGRAGVRIIPAHAGQTCSTLSATSLTPDHPRACGAND